MRRVVRTGPVWLLGAALTAAAVLGWGGWHALTHASLSLRVEDAGLPDDRRGSAVPHAVTLTYLDAANAPLAVAHSVEPQGYILAVHPDPTIGNCEHRGIRAAPGPARQNDYADCYARHSAWASTWAPRVRSANLSIGGCALQQVPVRAYTSSGDWWLWWVPLPHVGGVPYRYCDLAVRVDSRACAAR